MKELPNAKDLAHETGVSVDMARGWLSGRGSITAKAMDTMARVWCFTPAELVDLFSRRADDPVDLRDRNCRNISEPVTSPPRRRSVRERRGVSIEKNN